MLTNRTRKSSFAFKVVLVSMAAVMILAACTGAPGQSTDLYSPAATQAAAIVPTVAAAATQAVQSVPVTGSTPTASASNPYADDNPEKVYPTSPAGAADDSAEVKVSENAALGKFIVDSAGRTLYIFTKDVPGKSNCTGECLVNWPALITVKAPKGDDGVDASRLGTITRDDGATQVTWDDMPLYYFIGDVKPGDTVGQNVGGVWFVVDPTAPAAAPSSASSGTAAAPLDDSAEIKVSQSADLGTFLVDSSGRTLYIFSKDTPGKSNCSGQCLVNWPPLVTVKAPKADDGVDASKLGTIKRDDGSLQVTYGNQPLYYFAKDLKPGDTLGQNVGGVWYVLAP